MLESKLYLGGMIDSLNFVIKDVLMKLFLMRLIPQMMFSESMKHSSKFCAENWRNGVLKKYRLD